MECGVGAAPSRSHCHIADTMQILQFLSNFQSNQAKAPTSTIEPMIGDPALGVTHVEVDNLFATGRWLVSVVEERTVLMTRSEVEAILRKEKEKDHVSLICLGLNPPYAVEVATKPYPVGTSLHSSKGSMEEQEM